MRIVPNPLEELAPVPFVFLVGVAAGILQIVPGLLEQRVGIASAFVAQILVDGAGILLWWSAVRRRRFSVWRTAWHVMLALDMGQVVAGLLGLAIVDVRISVSQFLWPVLSALLVLSPIRFLVTAALVGLGRLVPGSGTSLAPRASPPNHPAAVT